VGAVALDLETLKQWYREMVLIRRFEEEARVAYQQGKIGGFLHLYIGEEAIAVGAIHALRPQDHIVTHYRDHGYAIVRGLDPKRLMAELAQKTGVDKGAAARCTLPTRPRISGAAMPSWRGM
jgi:pyruvate dehydrogenase E1 component alpha subunit